MIADPLEKEIKTTVFMIKQLKEGVGKVKEIMYQQNAGINKELENLKGNPDLFFSELKNTITEMKHHQRDSKTHFSGCSQCEDKTMSMMDQRNTKEKN